jgi:hypothetical protein
MFIILVGLLLTFLFPIAGVPILLYGVYRKVKPYVKKVINGRIAEGNRRYEILPEIGKARVDKEVAELKMAGVVVAAPLLAVTAFLLNPVGALVTAGTGYKWLKNAWGDCDEELAAAEARRAEALGPEAVISLIRKRQRELTEALRRQQRKLRVRARRRMVDYPIFFGVIFGLITFMFFMDQPPGFRSFAPMTGIVLLSVWLVFYLGSLQLASRERKEATEIAQAINELCKECDQKVNEVSQQAKAIAAQTPNNDPPFSCDFKEYVENWME